MQNPINTSPISQFIQLVKTAELSQSKEVKITIQQARLISLALVEVLEKMNTDYGRLLADTKNNSADVITINMDGGVFGESE